jgi:3-hydroxyisobutyrate dehydrogenase-like beta-hydroxyacid dehydrogenase
MGHPMASRLLAAGVDLHVWNRTRARAAGLVRQGATLVGGPAALADHEVVFTMVGADADLLDVTLGAGGLLAGDPPDGDPLAGGPSAGGPPARAQGPRYLVDASTVSAAASAEVREAAAAHGRTLLAAPVSGNPRVVLAGRLSVAVSGPRPAFDAVVPLLRLLGSAVTYVGEGDTARLVKLAHNLVLGVLTQALAETAVLAERAGVSRAAYLEFLNSSVLGSVFTRYKTPALVRLELAPTFTTELLAKDLDLGLAAGRELGVPLPVAAATQQLVRAAVGRGHGGEDFAALLIEQARSAGLEPVPEDVEVDDGLDS